MKEASIHAWIKFTLIIFISLFSLPTALAEQTISDKTVYIQEGKDNGEKLSPTIVTFNSTVKNVLIKKLQKAKLFKGITTNNNKNDYTLIVTIESQNAYPANGLNGESKITVRYDLIDASTSQYIINTSVTSMAYVDLGQYAMANPFSFKPVTAEALDQAVEKNVAQFVEQLPVLLADSTSTKSSDAALQNNTQGNNEINTKLLEAANAGDLAKIENLIKQGADVNTINKEGYPVLELAITSEFRTGNPENTIKIIKLLVEKGADVNGKSPEGWTALMETAKGRKSFFTIFGRESVKDKDQKQKDVILVFSKIAKLLIENGADVNAKDKTGKTALMVAAGNNQTETVKLLIEKGADVNAKDKDGHTALGYLIYEYVLLEKQFQADPPAVLNLFNISTAEIAKLLINAGADINTQDTQGYSVLMYLAKTNHPQIAKLLIDNGADVNAKNIEGYSILMIYAATTDYTQIVKLLIANGADVNAKLVRNNATVLMFAGDTGHTEVAKLLIEHGADIDGKDINGGTALMSAAAYGNTDVVQLLIEKGANINTQDIKGDTALILAVAAGHIDTVKLLISKGADVNIKSKYGDTALDLASQNNRGDIVELLKKAHTIK